jgi:hypothetical protein
MRTIAITSLLPPTTAGTILLSSLPVYGQGGGNSRLALTGNKLTELGIVCALNSGRIVETRHTSKPVEIIPIFPRQRRAGEPEPSFFS